jgi:acyl-coenzyme A thioesterase PaaI-like protein
VTLAILDEGVAWAAIAIGCKFAVTHTTSTLFDRPVKLGVSYRVEARVVEQTAERIIADAEVLDEYFR